MPLLSFGNFVTHQCVLFLSVRVTWIPSSQQNNTMSGTFTSWVAGQEGSLLLHPPFGWVYCLNKECAFETYQHCTQYRALWSFLGVETPKAWFVVVCFSLWQVTDPSCWWKCSSGRGSVEPSVIPLQTGFGGEGEDQRPEWPCSRPQPLLMALFIARGACGWMKVCHQILLLWRGGRRLRPSHPRHGELAKTLWYCVSKLPASSKLCLGISRAALCLLMTFLKEDLLTGRAGTSGLLGQREPQLPTLHANT